MTIPPELTVLPEVDSMDSFLFLRAVEKHNANPANTGAIGLPEPVKSVLVCG